MTAARFRSLSAAVLAVLCALVLGVTSVLTSAFVFGAQKFIANVALLAGEGWIMSGTGQPDPAVGPYMALVEGLYLPQSELFPGQPTFSGYTFNPLPTPESFCPPLCFPGPPDHPEWTDLSFGDSVNVGVGLLHDKIVPSLQNGEDVAVLGFSQSAMIATQEMNNLIENTPAGVDLSNLHVVLIGDLNSPIGGVLDRLQFPDGIGPSFSKIPQHLPFLDVPLSMDPTPTAPFPTAIYTAEYDGYANAPRDPLNILADINALLGVRTVHNFYPIFDNLADTINLGTIGDTNFYMIPQVLPILWPLYHLSPYVLPVFAEAIAPVLKLIIDWSYGNPGDPGAGITVGGVEPIGAAGPWQVNATGHLTDSGVGGFFPLMDPLQMIAGIQYALVHSLVDPINEILNEIYGSGNVPAGATDFMNGFSDVLLTLSGYTLVNGVDQFLLSGWNDLATALNVEDILGPDAIFSGDPLISAAPLIGLVGGVFDIFNFFGA